MYLKCCSAQHSYPSHRLLVSPHQPGYRQNYTIQNFMKKIQDPYMLKWDKDFIPFKKNRETYFKISSKIG